MNRKIVAFGSAIGGVAAALIGTQAFGSNQWVTYVALGGLAIATVLTHNTTEQVSKDLHNGTFEELLRAALKKIAEEDGTPLEIVQEPTEERREDTP